MYIGISSIIFCFGFQASKLDLECVIGSQKLLSVIDVDLGIYIAVIRLLRKEVIQPQVPLRLPCYDFIPVTSLALGPCLLAVGSKHFGCDRLP